MAQDGGLQLWQRQLQLHIASMSSRFKEALAYARQHLPVSRQRASRVVQVTHRDAAAQVRRNVVQVFRLAAVDVARQVQVEVVLRIGNLGQRNLPSVARYLGLLGEGVDDAVDVLLAQAVLVAVLEVALAGVDQMCIRDRMCADSIQSPSSKSSFFLSATSKSVVASHSP